MASAHSRMRCGEFRTTYQSDMTIFPTPLARRVAVASVLLFSAGLLGDTFYVPTWVVIAERPARSAT